MAESYHVRLIARNEVVEYRDELDSYWFDVNLVDKTWILFLPGRRGEISNVHELDADEQRRVRARITTYLSTIKWFGLFGEAFFGRGEKASRMSVFLKYRGSSRRHLTPDGVFRLDSHRISAIIELSCTNAGMVPAL